MRSGVDKPCGKVFNEGMTNTDPTKYTLRPAYTLKTGDRLPSGLEVWDTESAGYNATILILTDAAGNLTRQRWGADDLIATA